MKRIFLVILSFAAIVFTSRNSENQSANEVNNTPASSQQSRGELSYSLKQLVNSQVCMVNDQLMEKEQIPVRVGNKMYYGCCEGCVATLQNKITARTATDPLTAESVDKATAYIIVKPGTKDEVLYFASEANAKNYINSKLGK